MILVGGQRPQHVSPGPVTGYGDQLSCLLRENIALLPGSSARFGHPLVFLWEFLVILGHHGRVAAVVVPCGASGQRSGLGVFQDGFRVIRAVPVMVVGHDFRSQVCRGQRRPQRIPEERRLLGCEHLHAAVGRWGIERLILHA